MPIENKRLLVSLDRARKEVIRDRINPLFPELSLDDIKPIMDVVALARSNYIMELFKCSKMTSNEPHLTPGIIKDLHSDRLIYDELLEAYKVLEASIEHGYLDVEH